MTNLKNLNRWILVVEDDVILSNTLSDMLLRLRYNIVTVRSPNDAIEKLQIQSFDFILLDFYLEHGRGNEVLTYIQKLAPKKKIPVILMSGALYRKEAFNELPNVNFVLVKPFTEDELLSALIELQEG